MHYSNKYEKYKSFQDMAKVICYIESGKLENPYDRLQGIGIFLLVELGYSFDEIKSIKLSDYHDDIIELPGVASLMEDSKYLWDHLKEQGRYGEFLLSSDIVDGIVGMEF